jgi:hypothetical protein
VLIALKKYGKRPSTIASRIKAKNDINMAMLAIDSELFMVELIKLLIPSKLKLHLELDEQHVNSVNHYCTHKRLRVQ